MFCLWLFSGVFITNSATCWWSNSYICTSKRRHSGETCGGSHSQKKALQLPVAQIFRPDMEGQSGTGIRICMSWNIKSSMLSSEGQFKAFESICLSQEISRSFDLSQQTYALQKYLSKIYKLGVIYHEIQCACGKGLV